MATAIKICGLRDVVVARQALRLGADYLGLVLTESSRQVTLAEAEAIIQGLPEGRFIAVGKDVDDTLFSAMLGLGVVGIQLHGETPVAWIQRAHTYGKQAWATTLDLAADVVLLDGVEPGSGQARSWEKPHWPRPLWLAGGLNPRNVRQVVQDLSPDGVDVSSGVEEGGTKSRVLIEQFIEEVRHGDQQTRA